MKLLVRWLLGLKSNSNNSATSTLRLLYTVIIHEGDLMEHRRLKSVQLKGMGATGSALTKGLQEGSALTKGWQEGSALTRGLQEGSALTKGLQEGSALTKGLQEGSALTKGWQKGSALTKGWQKGGAFAKGWQKESAFTKGWQQGNALKGAAKESFRCPAGNNLREENGHFCLFNFATLDQLLLEEKQQTCPSEARRALLVGLMPNTTSDLAFLDDKLFDLITRFVLVLQQTRTGSVTSTGWLLYDEAC